MPGNASGRQGVRGRRRAYEAEEEDLPKPFERSELYPDLPAPVKVHPEAMERWILANCEISDPPFFNEKRWEKIQQILEMNMSPS